MNTKPYQLFAFFCLLVFFLANGRAGTLTLIVSEGSVLTAGSVAWLTISKGRKKYVKQEE